MYQLQNQPLADLMALHPDGDVTQSVTTGGNELHNDAAIVDVNPDATYVKGQIYTDSILVQANLVPTGADHAVNADTHTLVTELIAFVDDHPQDTAGPPPAAIVNIGAVRPDGEHAALASRISVLRIAVAEEVSKCGAGIIVQAAPGAGA